MDIWEVFKKRKSARSFDPKIKISEEQLTKILAAGKQAPSAGRIYPVDFFVVNSKEDKKKIAEAANNQNFLIEASLIIVVVANVEKSASYYGERGRSLYAIQDAAAATENMILATVALGLATCWVGAFDEDLVREALGLNGGERPLTILPIGQEK